MTAESDPTELPTVAEIQRRFAELSERIEAVGAKQHVTVVGVTKTFSPELITRAVGAGLSVLGENYAQELLTKYDHALGLGTEAEPVQWHFIGGMQRNKVKLLAGKIALWQTVDRASLVTEIAKRSPGDRILIQVNTTGESQKSGCEPGEVAALVEAGNEAGLEVAGLMTVGPTGGADPRPAFELLASLGQTLDLPELSMGMSNDFEQAVAFGSTIVRVGTALFGPRRRS